MGKASQSASRKKNQMTTPDRRAVQSASPDAHESAYARNTNGRKTTPAPSIKNRATRMGMPTSSRPAEIHPTPPMPR